MVCMAIMLGSTVVGLQHYLVNTKFQFLEQEFARLNIDRIANRFSVELNKIDTSVYDWSSWNDTYTFAQDRNNLYVESNLYMETFLNLGTDVVLFVNRQGEVLWGGVYEFQPDNEVIDRADILLHSLLLEVTALTEIIDFNKEVDDQVHQGLFHFDGLPVLFAIRPIYNSFGEGEARGFLLFGKTLTEYFLAQLEGDVALKFEISEVMNQTALSALAQYDIVAASETVPLRISKPFLPSESGGFLITTEVDKRFTQIGLAATQAVILAFILIGLLVTLVTWWWLQHTTILPIKRLKNSIIATTSNNDYSQRLDVTNSDEVSALAITFNDLLETVEQRTQVLNSTNEQLHKEQQQLHIVQIELKRANAELKILSEKDSLTGLYNRMAMERKLTQEWNVLRRKQEPLSVLMIDIDRFKEYNDLYGHQAGDDCLRRVAIIFSSIANRASDMVARYGGEEFILILPGTAFEEAYQMAQNLLDSIVAENIQHAYGDHGYLTASIGVACAIPSESLTIQNLIHNADEALYRAKKHGRNQVCL